MKKFESYYDYQLVLSREILVPFLNKMGISLNGERVLDVGCGEGGILSGLALYFKFRGLGIDYDRDMISKCQRIPSISFEAGDFYTYDFKDSFDFILLRDVLEHSSYPAEMLARTSALLSANGLAYITYTPYLSPFGGHQHNGSSFFSNFPYIHFLPELLFLKLIRPHDSLYKTSQYLTDDLKRIRKTSLTTGRVKRICNQHGLKVFHKKIFIIRPDYRYKFGLPEISMPAVFPLSTLFDPFCTAVELLASKK